MPHIKGLGSLDWYFITAESWQHLERLAKIHTVEAPSELVSVPPIPEERSFEFCSETARTWVSLLFRPDEELGEFLSASVGSDGRLFCFLRKTLPRQLLRFRNLLPLTEASGYEWIEFKQVYLGIRVSFFVKGMILSPEGVMRGIVRRLS